MSIPVYESDDATQAQIVLHLLEQAGIDAQLLGGHPAGGIGDPPGSIRARVFVSEEDADTAAAVVEDWQGSPVELPVASSSVGGFSPGWMLAGVVLGVVVTTLFFGWRLQATQFTTTYDYNNDGRIDEWVYYRGDYASRVDVDRNFDGEVDQKWVFSTRGAQEQVELDEDFDGRFETVTRYRYGQPVTLNVDDDGDGLSNMRQHFRDGVLVKADFYHPSRRHVVTSNTYRMNRLVSSSIDTDDDGELDTLIEYDEYGHETARSSLP